MPLLFFSDNKYEVKVSSLMFHFKCNEGWNIFAMSNEHMRSNDSVIILIVLIPASLNSVAK